MKVADVKQGDVLRDMSYDRERVLVLVEEASEERIVTRRFEDGEFWAGSAEWVPSRFYNRVWERVPYSRIPVPMKQLIGRLERRKTNHHDRLTDDQILDHAPAPLLRVLPFTARRPLCAWIRRILRDGTLG